MLLVPPQRRPDSPSRLVSVFPFLRWWPAVTQETLRADLAAGVTAAVIVLPQGVAFATLAGMPPEYGLYAAMVPAALAALFGSSWHVISGPTNAISLVVFATMSPFAAPQTPEYIGLVLTLTFLTGTIQLVMGIARMGMLVNFISHTVVVGFTAGAALLIIASQIRNFFGVSIESGSSFVQSFVQLGAEFSNINPYVLTVSIATLGTGIAARCFFAKIPYMIVAMAAGSVVALGLQQHFGAAAQIPTVGALPGGLPPLSAPDLSLEAIQKTAPIAFAVAILALAEAVSIGRSIALRSEQRIDGNQEFIGQGVSNIGGAFFSAYASSGSFNRSGLNYEAGARTPLAAVSSAVFLMLVLTAVAPLGAYLPLASMAAILFLVGWSLIDSQRIRSILRASRSETGVLAVTFLSTLLLEIEFAIYAGIIISLILYLNRTSKPVVVDVKPDPAEGRHHFSTDTGLSDCPQLKMVRIDGSLFFGAVNHVQQALEAIDDRNGQQRHALIVGTSINFIDVAGAEMLVQEARRRRRFGGALYYYQMKNAVRALMERGGYLEDFGAENVLPAKGHPVSRIYHRLDAEICRHCHARIFPECHEFLPNGEPRL